MIAHLVGLGRYFAFRLGVEHVRAGADRALGILFMSIDALAHDGYFHISIYLW
jgi:hypothetical protein